jgi:hypothetical protein
MVPLPVELPKPGMEGTPPNFNIPNLEKPSAKPRPPFLVPADVTNVALNKKVTSSEKDPLVGDLTMITDGDTEQVEGNDVELGAGVQWVTIDLASPQEIYGILFWHYYQPRVYYSVIVQTADDEAFKQNVQTWFNNDINNKAGLGAGKNLNYIESYEGKLVDSKGVRARYVRLYSAGSNANALNHYVEVEVFGKPAK